MKKYIALLLVFVLTLSLCACGGEGGSEEKGTFRAGFYRADISPEEIGVPMGGYTDSSKRLSTGYLTPLYAIGVAVQDEAGNTAVIVSLDYCSFPTDFADEIRSWVETELGIPKSNIILNSLHQHSTPDAANTKVDSAARYKERIMSGIKEAIQNSIADLSPAEMYINTVQTEALSFIRHYWANDGSLVTSHTGNASAGLKGYESEADRTMRLVKFTRAAEDKDDIIMVNFQGHPHMGTSSSQTDTHSDWPGVMRDAVTEELGVNCIYVGGAGGNMDSTSKIGKDNITRDFRKHGQRAAEYVISAEEGYTKVNTGAVECKEVTVAYQTDHSMDHLLDIATPIHEARYQDMNEAEKLLAQYPEIHSVFHASAVVSKAKKQTTQDMNISAISFGDVAITCHPYEMFDTNGMELRDGTVGNPNYATEDQLENPYAMTLVASIGNGRHGYIPSQLGYINGGYATDTTPYAPGTGEQIVTDMLKILNELHGE